MGNKPTQAGREAVWVAFADHFLDTETRHDLPLAALAALEAGFSVDEARDIWCYEVSPVLSANLWQVAGEWAGWDREWLVARLSGVQRRRPARPGLLSWALYRLSVHFNHGSWVAIEACMRLLEPLDAAGRLALTDDLHALGRHYFAFLGPSFAGWAPERRAALRRCFEEQFLPIFRSLVVTQVGESPRAFEARVRAALEA